jgi:hypothetical protein
MPDTVSRLMEALASARFACGDEAELQEAVALVLDGAGLAYQREVRLSPRDRVDFMVDGGIALELKVTTSQKSLLAQVLRYAAHSQVTAIVVGSTTHRALGIPTEAHGKPMRVIHMVNW